MCVIVCCMLHVVCCVALHLCVVLCVVCCMLCVVCCVLRVVCCMLCVVCCVLRVACCVLRVACCVLRVACACCVLRVACCVLCVVCWFASAPSTMGSFLLRERLPLFIFWHWRQPIKYVARCVLCRKVKSIFQERKFGKLRELVQSNLPNFDFIRVAARDQNSAIVECCVLRVVLSVACYVLC